MLAIAIMPRDPVVRVVDSQASAGRADGPTVTATLVNEGPEIEVGLYQDTAWIKAGIGCYAGCRINVQGNDIVAGLEILLDNPRRAREMGAKGRERVVEEYVWDRVVANVRGGFQS